MGFSYQTLFTRSSGVLLHITSLPGGYGIGDVGKEAYEFIDFLHAAGQRLWQVLPLTPTGYGNSPYYSYSAMANNHLLISPDALVQRGYLAATDIQHLPPFSGERVDYSTAIPAKMALLHKAFQSFSQQSNADDEKKFRDFCSTHQDWLDDYALFVALKTAKYNGKPWSAWDEGDRLRKKSALTEAKRQYRTTIEFHKFLQYEFQIQWQSLKNYAESKAVAIIGDIPIFIAYDSADVWSHPSLFRLDKNRLPRVVSGVPPDYFSETGQLWGNPHYNWDEMQKSNFAWWGNRFERCFELYHIVRVDHFRGFEAFWEIPASEKTAIKGRWVKAPGFELFSAMQERFGALPIIAEDLGVITPEVTTLRKEFLMPGMKILQFGYESCNPTDAFLPHNFEPDCVVYTGTHDNDTTLGWFRHISEQTRQNVIEYLRPHNEEDAVWEMIRMGMFSTALFSITPMQDILTLDGEARMNFPGKADGNWEYRLQSHQIREHQIERLAMLTRLANRRIPQV